MSRNYNVGIIGATGMVGQRFITLLCNHPWFRITALAASPRSAGKPYAQAVGAKWSMQEEIPAAVKDMTVLDAAADAEKIAASVDFVFCAVDMKKDEIRALEEKYARLECPVISNNSAHRGTPDVPMIIPELNAAHAAVIPFQRKRLGTKRGFIAVKSNCSLQSYVPALYPLNSFGVKCASVSTSQAISGAGKTFAVWGLAFKPKTNDMREAPAITIINALLERGAKVQAYDPKAFDSARFIFKDRIEYAKSSYDALNGADAMLLLTEWNEFRRPDFDRIKSLLKTPVIFDGRNQYNAKRLLERGFEYTQIGKKTM